MVKQLNSNERAQIVALLDEGISPKTIARKFQVAKSTISRVKSKYKEYKTFDHLGGNGRPLKLTSDVVNLIKIENLKNNKKSLRKISKSLSNTSEVNISHASVRKALNFSNLFAYSPIKKPLLTEKNKNLRYDFSKMVLKMEKRQIKKIFSVMSLSLILCTQIENFLSGENLEKASILKILHLQKNLVEDQ